MTRCFDQSDEMAIPAPRACQGSSSRHGPAIAKPRIRSSSKGDDGLGIRPAAGRRFKRSCRPAYGDTSHPVGLGILRSGGQWPLMRSRSVRATSPGSGSAASSLARRRAVSPYDGCPSASRTPSRTGVRAECFGADHHPGAAACEKPAVDEVVGALREHHLGNAVRQRAYIVPSPRDGRRRSTGAATRPGGCNAPPWRRPARDQARRDRCPHLP